MTIEEAIRRIKDFGLHHAIKDLPYSMLTVEAFEMVIQIVKQLSSLESEYNAYHTDSDYWKGIKYAIDVLNHKN